MHPIYGAGEILCNANLLVVPLSLGQERGPRAAAIKGRPSSLLRENLRDNEPAGRIFLSRRVFVSW